MDLKQQLMRDLHGIIRDAYSPSGRALYGPQPSGNYAAGPLPDYFSGRESSLKGGAMLNGGLAGLGAAASAMAPEMSPGILPWAALSGINSMVNYADSKNAGNAADMWSNTGLPQQPPPQDTVDMDLLERMLKQLQQGR